MPTPLTLTTELTREGLLAVRDEIDALLATIPASAPAAPPKLDLDPLARELKRHLGPAIQKLVKALAASDKPFTWDDLERTMKVDKGTLKSWHRSMSKPLGRIRKANPGTPEFMTSRWDGQKNTYVVDRDWAAAVKRIW